MRTIYIVFFNDRMVFAFDTLQAAESYIRTATQNDPGVYTPNNLYYRSVDYFEWN